MKYWYSADCSFKTIEFVSERTGVEPQSFQPGRGLAVLNGSDIVAGVVFHEYRKMAHGARMALSVAVDDPKCVTKRLLRTVFAIPFEDADVVRLEAETTADNEKCRKFVEKLGFTLEGRLRKAYDGVQDVLCYSMLKTECKWI